jgi:hypothetical protein
MRITFGPVIFALTGAARRPAGLTGTSTVTSAITVVVAVSTGSFFFVAFGGAFFLVFFFALAFTSEIFTFLAVSIAEELSPPSLNHSEIVAASPAETADMWFVISGMPSLSHFATMSLEPTPSFLASWWTLLIATFLATFDFNVHYA